MTFVSIRYEEGNLSGPRSSVHTNLHRVQHLKQEYPDLKNVEALVPWILGRLWKNRNELVLKGREFGANEVLVRTQEDADEWIRRKEAQNVRKAPTTTPSGQTRNKWEAPPQSWVKCNFDGAWPTEGLKCGLGWVLRDHTGKVLWLGARAVVKVRSVLEVEVEALRWAVLSLSRFNYRKIIFEVDSQQLVSLVT
ncbi:unnamed protein product [Arabidopsis thaliana]|uniref:(thale cress) hypothetical protein n=1 Tax=Arabidopsis thaliana TaxID=3702 RepID=A0A7G2EYC0_ARATH|nr:unnamed protein product [Arabidopsis thaliana]